VHAVLVPTSKEGHGLLPSTAKGWGVKVVLHAWQSAFELSLTWAKNVTRSMLPNQALKASAVVSLHSLSLCAQDPWELLASLSS
jgi:hypothetical protein